MKDNYKFNAQERSCFLYRTAAISHSSRTTLAGSTTIIGSGEPNQRLSQWEPLGKLSRIVLAAIAWANIYAAPIVATGSFANPIPEGPGSILFVGADSFTWGGGSPSRLSFSGASLLDPLPGSFVVGTLFYSNGAIPAGTGALGIELILTVPLGDATPTPSFRFSITITDTPNNGDPDASADFVVLPDASIPVVPLLIGGVPNTLIFMGFGKLTDNGFIRASEFHVHEGASSSADLLVGVRPVDNPMPTPEPSTAAMITLALIGLAGRHAHREARRRHPTERASRPR